MRYTGTLIAVIDMEKSKAFYCSVLGRKIVGDFGANVQLDGGLFLQTADTWKTFIGNRNITLQHNAGELYFEEPELDELLLKLEAMDVEYVHRLIEHNWGQRAVRFYDPDHHIIEVAEPLSAVVMRFADSGMTTAQVAMRMDIPEDYVLSCLSQP